MLLKAIKLSCPVIALLAGVFLSNHAVADDL